MMGGILIGILGTLVQMGIMVGVVVLIVKLASGRNKTSTESVGVLIRRIFVYLVMLSMLILVGVGVAGLIDAALPSVGEITDTSAAAARSIAFVVVGLPVYVALALYTSRRLKADPEEQRSAGWAFYITAALVGSLVTTMALVGAILSNVLDGDPPERMLIINSAIWSGVWVAHWWIAQRFEPRKNGQLHRLLGSAAGLIWAFAGAIATIAALLSAIYDRLFFDSIALGGIDELVRPAMILVVGLPVWWWYWLRHTRGSERTPLWLVYTLLLGVLGGTVSAITGAGVALFSVLAWFLGDTSGPAAAHFDLLPEAVGALLIGGAAWAYHAYVLGERKDRVRCEIDRIYDYLLAGAGLAVAAAGMATLIATMLMGVSSRGITAIDSHTTVATALTLLVIGVPLWWRYWSTIQHYRRGDTARELRSITRRIYIIGLLGIAAVVAIISLIMTVFVLVEDILEGIFGAATLDDSAIALALLTTAGALFWYHFAMFGEDRKDSAREAELGPASQEEQATPSVPRGALEQALDNLGDAGHDRVEVLLLDDGYEITPLTE